MAQAAGLAPGNENMVAVHEQKDTGCRKQDKEISLSEVSGLVRTTVQLIRYSDIPIPRISGIYFCKQLGHLLTGKPSPIGRRKQAFFPKIPALATSKPDEQGKDSDMPLPSLRTIAETRVQHFELVLPERPDM